MFQGKKPTNTINTKDIRAFLEQGCSLEGKLRFEGVVRLNGTFNGDIDSKDTLILGETAYVEGHIRIGSLVVGGHIRGDITATQRVEILPTGRVEGHCRAPIIIAHEGAELEGNFSIANAQKPVSLLRQNAFPEVAESVTLNITNIN